MKINYNRIYLGNNLICKVFLGQNLISSCFNMNLQKEENDLCPYLLLHMEEENDSKLFFDSSNYKHNIISNNALIKTNEFKFGQSSAYFNGNDAILIVEEKNEVLVTEDQDFSIEFWLNLQSYSISNCYILGNEYWSLKINNQGQLIIYDGILTINTNVIIEKNNWSNVVVSRKNGVIRCFINGNSLFFQSNNSSIFSSSNGLIIGGKRNGLSFSNYINAYLDELRITVGFGYEENFITRSDQFFNCSNWYEPIINENCYYDIRETNPSCGENG